MPVCTALTTGHVLGPKEDTYSIARNTEKLRRMFSILGPKGYVICFKVQLKGVYKEDVPCCLSQTGMSTVAGIKRRCPLLMGTKEDVLLDGTKRRYPPLLGLKKEVIC